MTPEELRDYILNEMIEGPEYAKRFFEMCAVAAEKAFGAGVARPEPHNWTVIVKGPEGVTVSSDKMLDEGTFWCKRCGKTAPTLSPKLFVEPCDYPKTRSVREQEWR